MESARERTILQLHRGARSEQRFADADVVFSTVESGGSRSSPGPSSAPLEFATATFPHRDLETDLRDKARAVLDHYGARDGRIDVPSFDVYQDRYVLRIDRHQYAEGTLNESGGAYQVGSETIKWSDRPLLQVHFSSFGGVVLRCAATPPPPRAA